MDKQRRFAGFAWAVLAWNVLVVMWGALVRATGSGAGCGEHWPLCNGAVIPPAPGIKTLIEFTHRVSSGLALIGVIVLFVWAWRLFPRGHAARRWAAWSVALIAIEAALGAGLVLLRYVEQNASAGRVIYLCLHLANTLMLVAVLQLTALAAQRPLRRLSEVPGLGCLALLGALAATLTGGIAALGDTLYPAISMIEGVKQEFSSTSPALLQLRLMHPVLALVGGFLVLAAAQRALAARWRRALIGCVLLQLAAGAVNVWLLAPVSMQVLHLGLAELVWLVLIRAALEAPGQET